eukprot:COSAG05_NODE_2284_length_3284_cov_22.607535_3_plen_71_part_00
MTNTILCHVVNIYSEKKPVRPRAYKHLYRSGLQSASYSGGRLGQRHTFPFSSGRSPPPRFMASGVRQSQP